MSEANLRLNEQVGLRLEGLPAQIRKARLFVLDKHMPTQIANSLSPQTAANDGGARADTQKNTGAARLRGEG